MRVQKTNHGCRYVEFQDLYGKPCSLQESSLAIEPAIWFGVDLDYGPFTRMHLSRVQVQDLLPLLQHFVSTGDLPDQGDQP